MDGRPEAVVLNSLTTPDITTVVGELVCGATLVRLGVGYLFVEGLGPLIERLTEIPRTELLIGNVVNRLTDEQIRKAGSDLDTSAQSDEDILANYRMDRNRAAIETALNLRQTLASLPHTSATSSVVVGLAQLILGGRLHVRLSSKCRLHAKVTMASYPDGHAYAPGRAIVGTSNITLPTQISPGAPMPDIDVLVGGASNYQAVTRWFESHWDQAQDFHRELFDELGRAWPLAATS